MIKKIALIFFIITLSFLLIPKATLAMASYEIEVFEDTVKKNGRMDEGEDLSPNMTGLWACYEGLVPCGKKLLIAGEEGCGLGTGIGTGGGGTNPQPTEEIIHCQLCHFFVLISGIINYVFIDIIPPIAVLMLVIGGAMFYFGGGKPDLISKSKSLLKSVAIGLAIAYGSFMIVGIFLTVLGATEVGPVKDVWKHDKIFTVNCPVRIPSNLIK